MSPRHRSHNILFSHYPLSWGYGLKSSSFTQLWPDHPGPKGQGEFPPHCWLGSQHHEWLTHDQGSSTGMWPEDTVHHHSLSLQQDLKGENGQREFIPKLALAALCWQSVALDDPGTAACSQNKHLPVSLR